jgi:putative transposase
VLLYYLVFPETYRRAVFDSHVDEVLKEVCLEIELRYQFKFIEIGTGNGHVDCLVQSVPTYPITKMKIVTMIKSLTIREIFKRNIQALPSGEKAVMGW